MKINNNQDFFKKVPEATREPIEHPKPTKPHGIIIQPSAQVGSFARTVSETLRHIGMNKFAFSIEQMVNEAKHDRFVISVVGEFNNGKSTFVNNLLGGAPMLPTAILPSTAILTRVRYAKQPQMAVLDDKGTVKARLQIKPESWKGLTADNFGGNNPSGYIVVGIDNEWLGHNQIEIIDCPGLDDLTTNSATITGDALSRTDGAIIATRANKPLGLTERTFIKQRIIQRKTPYVMLILTMLDLVPLKERNDVVEYILNTIEHEGWNIPVFIPSKIEMPDDRYHDLIGLDNLKHIIELWINDTERQEREDSRIKAAIADVLAIASSSIKEEIKLCSLEEEKHLIEINKKKQAIEQFEVEWGKLSLELQKRSNECYKKFLDKIDSLTGGIVEKLQLDASHTNKPAEWWTNDYPYRLKMELATLSIQLDNLVQHTVMEDARWFNTQLQQHFGTAVNLNPQNVADPDDYKENLSNTKLEFEDINKKASLARIGTALLSISGFFLLPPGLGIIATMGIGTGGTILTGNFTSKKLEEQRETLRKTIAKDIPVVIGSATASSERRVTAIYDDILRQSTEKKALWKDAQVKALSSSALPNKEKCKKLEENLIIIDSLTSKL